MSTPFNLTFYIHVSKTCLGQGCFCSGKISKIPSDDPTGGSKKTYRSLGLIYIFATEINFLAYGFQKEEKKNVFVICLHVKLLILCGLIRKS